MNWVRVLKNYITFSKRKFYVNTIFLASILVEDDVKHKSTLAVLSTCKEQIDLLYDRVGEDDIEIIREEMMQSDFRAEEYNNEDTFK